MKKISIRMGGFYGKDRTKNSVISLFKIFFFDQGLPIVVRVVEL